MKDKKDLLGTKQLLSDEQLEKAAGAGWPRDPNKLYKVYCNECLWTIYNVTWDDTFKVSKEHREQTGHMDIRVF